VRKADNLTAICEPVSRQCGIFNILQTYRPPRPVTGIALHLFTSVGWREVELTAVDQLSHDVRPLMTTVDQLSHDVRLLISFHCWIKKYGKYNFILMYLITIMKTNYLVDRLCGLVVSVPGCRPWGLGFDFRRYHIFCVAVGLERGPLSLVRIYEVLLERKVAAPV
jgi:hypothetical protein